ncbi:MAG: LysR family transcriptional regulator [Oscillospiraceae bacterium]|nr:LysR family transcriptional regulator [Oscillospiraceae bacterium]
MISSKMETLLTVAELQNFTRAAQALSLTQPAVSHHIGQLESELGTPLFVRGRGGLRLTAEGEIAVKYAKRIKALYAQLQNEIQNAQRNLTRLRVGITHTSESNLTAEALAKCSALNNKLSITILTDTINNLYTMLENYEIDLAVVEGSPTDPSLHSLMLDTDYLVCVVSVNNPLAKHAMVTLGELRRERMILRLPTSATRILFESTLQSINESIDSFNITLEVDNIATIKDLIRKDMGVSILPKSACMDELRKGKIIALPIENLSMLRETKLVYNKDFSHPDILQEIITTYHDTVNIRTSV